MQDLTIIGRVAQPVLGDLFVDWFSLLVDREFGCVGRSTNGERQSIRVRDGSECGVVLSKVTGEIAIEAPNAIRSRVLKLAESALVFTQSGKTGDAAWWKMAFSSKPEPNEALNVHMMRSLSQHRRFVGPWRLGSDALVTFEQQGAEHPPLFSNQAVQVVFRSVGPGHGPFGARIARKNSTLIRAILSLITASPPGGQSPVFPADADELTKTSVLLDSGSIPELHIKGFPVWQALGALLASGSCEAFDRVFGALVAFEHALLQKTAESSIVFFVTAIEALAVPNAGWKNERVTKRFVEFLLLVCPEAINEVLNHANFKQAFGSVATTKAFAQQLYHLRSHPIHTGKLGEITSGLFGDPEDQIRIALIADVARAAILSFLLRPFSMLIGHPNLDPLLRIEVSPELYRSMHDRAAQKNLSVSAWVQERLHDADRSTEEAVNR